MRTPKLTIQYLWWSSELVLLAGSVTAGVWLARPQEWHPLPLVVLLLALAFGGERFTVELRHGVLSASQVAVVLAMGLLGPTPAMTCGIAAMVAHSAAGRRKPGDWLNNISGFAAFPLAGGLTLRAIASALHVMHGQHLAQSLVFGLILLGVFGVTVGFNFLLFAIDACLNDGRSPARLVREQFLPLLPGQLAGGMLATCLAVAYRSAGLPILLASLPVLLIFRQLTVALLRSEDRADQLEARTIHLVSLQLGVLRTLVRALGMRDETTGRHAAAVAVHARKLAEALGASEDEQYTVHTAGLLHDIGKFTWPDRVLQAEVVSAQDQEIVRRHPQDGAELVGALDGFGPVADAILYHHERVDGSGYPAGLIGKEIPLSSRILAICCVYDTMTQRDSYRPPMDAAEAIGELRVSAERGQLDGELVGTFITMLEGTEPLVSLGERPDFDTELAFDRRVLTLANPGAPRTQRRTVQTKRSSVQGGRERRSTLRGFRDRLLHRD